ncbi:MAG: glycosyltransferase family 2 protein [Verrucomicrobia bacterium]|nr:MAG: glycosyltransferase family 2 protein [Verrucomicrobiota bacterium]
MLAHSDPNRYSNARLMTEWIQESLLLIPAFNEEASLGALLDEVGTLFPALDVAVINDCSGDRTAHVARTHGVVVLDLPCNLGVGGVMQAGFEYACARDYRYVMRCDGDGQHPPSEIPKLAAAMQANNADVVIGSRFLGPHAYTSTPWRNVGIAGLAALLSYACRQRVTDPTSGFQLINRPALHFFAKTYPSDYPEPESLALLTRQGYRVCETAVDFRARQGGCSSIGKRAALFYAMKVTLALLVDRARAADPRFSRQNMLEQLAP